MKCVFIIRNVKEMKTMNSKFTFQTSQSTLVGSNKFCQYQRINMVPSKKLDAKEDLCLVLFVGFSPQ